MSPSLPRIIVLKSSHRDSDGCNQIPFCVLHCDERDGYKNIHLCDKDDIASPHAKFQLIRVDPDKGLYNIRCCYNNKLWTGSNSGIIQAKEKKAAGDATLFKFEPVDTDNKKYRVMYMESKSYVCFDDKTLNPQWVLEANSTSTRDDSHDVFTVIDWESLVILPKEVAFKGPNGKYVYATTQRNDYYYFLVVSDDIGDREVRNQIDTLSDRKIAVKNLFRSKYWTYDDYYYQRGGSRIYVVPQSGDPSKDDSQFLPIKIDHNTIALRNVKLGTYCIWRRKGDYFLVSDDPDATISDEAKFQVEELVVSRKVYGVDFRFDDSLIYNEKISSKASARTANSSSTATKEELKLECKDTISSSYDASVSVKSISGFGLEATLPIVIGNVPLSFTPRAEVTVEKEKKYSWGDAKETSWTISVAVRVTVPAKTEVTTDLEATEAKCDIPFSYTQRDLTTGGEHVLQTRQDGVYTCTNCYNFNIKIKEKAI